MLLQRSLRYNRAMSDDILIFPIEERPARADAVRNRRRLLDIAQRLLDEGTLEDFTMSDIAKSAGVGKGTLYRHFADKAELCHALLDEAMRDFQADTLKHMRSGAPPEEILRWFLREVAAYVNRHIVPLHEASSQARTGDMLRHPAHTWWRQTIRGLLEQLHPAGDIDYLSDVLYVMLDVRTIAFQRRIQGYPLEQLQDGLVMVLDRFLQAG